MRSGEEDAVKKKKENGGKETKISIGVVKWHSFNVKPVKLYVR